MPKRWEYGPILLKYVFIASICSFFLLYSPDPLFGFPNKISKIIEKHIQHQQEESQNQREHVQTNVTSKPQKGNFEIIQLILLFIHYVMLCWDNEFKKCSSLNCRKL